MQQACLLIVLAEGQRGPQSHRRAQNPGAGHQLIMEAISWESVCVHVGGIKPFDTDRGIAAMCWADGCTNTPLLSTGGASTLCASSATYGVY